METPKKTTNKKDTLGKPSDHLPHHRSHHPSSATIVAELAEVDALIKETYVPEKAVLGTQRITYVPENIILGTQQSDRHGTPPYIFSFFFRGRNTRCV